MRGGPRAPANPAGPPGNSIMKTSVAVTLLFVGVVLLVYRANAATSLAAAVARAFSGTPIDRSILLIASGAAGIAVGAAGLILHG